MDIYVYILYMHMRSVVSMCEVPKHPTQPCLSPPLPLDFELCVVPSDKLAEDLAPRSLNLSASPHIHIDLCKFLAVLGIDRSQKNIPYMIL